MLFEAIHFEIISPEATMSSNMPDMTARGFWKYQLLSRDLKRVIRKASVKLMTNNDYSQLTKTITKGTKPPIAVLSQVCDLGGKDVYPAYIGCRREARTQLRV